MLLYDPSGDNDRKTKNEGWVPGRSIKRPTRRQWNSPRNYRTGAKTNQRQWFAITARMWELVTPAQIAAWAAAVQAYKDKALPGQKTPSSAFTLYMYVNLNRQASGSPITLDPPTAVGIPNFSITSVSLQGAPDAIDYVVHISQDQPDWALHIAISKPVLQGSVATREDVAALSKDEALTDGIHFDHWESSGEFGPNITGMSRHFLAVAVNKTTGQMSADTLITTIPYIG